MTLCCPELIVNCLFPKACLNKFKFTQPSRILAAFHLMGTVINKKKGGLELSAVFWEFFK